VITYTPAIEVLPEYTDERVRDGRTYGPVAAETLLRVPAEYRQAVMMELGRRLPSHAGIEAVRRQVVDEVLGQISRVAP
jgi:hypothetical protein